MGFPSPLNPQSPEALAVYHLFLFILGIALLIFLVVAFLVIFSMVRYHYRMGDGEPPQRFGNTRIEIVWTVIPLAILVIIFIYMLSVMRVTQASATPEPDLIVIGHQWWWEVQYPKEGFVTANEIHLQVGRKYTVELESADVIHDLWIPQLGDKTDLVPGRSNWMYLQASQPGTYLGTCAEFCGTDHALMHVRAIAQNENDYNAWLKSQEQAPVIPTSGDAGKGAALFFQLPCQSCHTIDGTQAKGDVGPNLSHVASRETLGAGSFDNSPGSLTAWLANPQSLKPGNLMPNLQLTNLQISELVAFLETLK